MVEIRIEDADLEDAVYRKTVSLGRFSDRVLVRTIIDAVRLLVILRHVRMHSGEADIAVVGDDGAAGISARFRGRNGQAVFEGAFDEVSRHGFLHWKLRATKTGRRRRIRGL